MESWAEVEAALVELGRLEQALLAIEVERAMALERAAEAARPLEAKQAELEALLERFCRGRWGEFARENGQGRRSRQLLFGRVGRSCGCELSWTARGCGSSCWRGSGRGAARKRSSGCAGPGFGWRRGRPGSASWMPGRWSAGVHPEGSP